jgi:hypothetical protein
MPRFEKDGITVETSIPREAARLRSEGFKEQAARTKAVREADADKTSK